MQTILTIQSNVTSVKATLIRKLPNAYYYREFQNVLRSDGQESRGIGKKNGKASKETGVTIASDHIHQIFIAAPSVEIPFSHNTSTYPARAFTGMCSRAVRNGSCGTLINHRKTWTCRHRSVVEAGERKKLLVSACTSNPRSASVAYLQPNIVSIELQSSLEQHCCF